MKRKRFSEEQIIAILREHEAGVATADLCRKRGMSSASLYAWKAKFGGMDVSGAQKLRVLEAENAKLKRLCPAAGCGSPERLLVAGLRARPNDGWALLPRFGHR